MADQRFDTFALTDPQQDDRFVIGRSGNTRNVRVKDIQPFFDAKAFGAAGDGAADDTAALQAILDEIESRGGGVLWFPEGTYLVEPLDVPPGTILGGEGAGSKLKLKGRDYGDTGTGNEMGILQISSVADVVIRDLYLDGNKSNVTGTNTLNIECINLSGVTDSLIENVWVVNSKGDGVDLDSCERVRVEGVRAEGCGGYGVHVSVDSLRVEVTHCRSYQCGLDQDRGGFDAHVSTRDVTYVGCIAIECQRGFNIVGPGASLHGCQAHDSVEDNFVAGSSGFRTSFHDCHSYGAGRHGFLIEQNDAQVEGCHSYESTQNNFEFAGSRIQCASCASHSAGNHGFLVDANDSLFVGCHDYDASQNSFRIEADRVDLENCRGLDSGNVVVINGHSVSITGGRYWNGQGTGIRANATANQLKVTGAYVGQCDVAGIWTEGDDVHVTGCYLRDNASEGIRLDGDSGLVSGNSSKNNTGTDIADNGTGNTVEGNKT